jgi:hypothetical protein
MPIGHITLDVKLAGKPGAGKPHARFDVAVAGNGADDPLEGDTRLKREKRLGLTRPVPLPRQLPTLPSTVLREPGGEIPPGHSPPCFENEDTIYSGSSSRITLHEAQ